MIDKLHYISQATENGTHLEAIEQVLKAGGKWIQLRIKNQHEAFVLEQAKEAKALCTIYGAKLIINDYPVIAHEIGADGLHLGLDDLPIREARAIVGDQMIIGGTANTFQHILQRVNDGADYIGFGPYRFTNTKQNLSPIVGLRGYSAVMQLIKDVGIAIPIIAIGGIESTDIIPLMETGIYGVAVSGALTNQQNMTGKLEELNASLNISYNSQQTYVKNSR